MFDEISKGRYWDKPWGLVSSCTRCSPGCKGCWALVREKRFHQGVEGKIEIHPERLDIPLKRKKPTVWAIWNDLFHENVDPNFIREAFQVASQRPEHVFLVLTKRVSRAAKWFEWIGKNWKPWPVPNIYLGVTVCNQPEADEKIPILLKIPAAVRFVSIEPMLGPICLDKCSPYILLGDDSNPGYINSFNAMCWHPLTCIDPPSNKGSESGINWVVLGGESGPGARPMHPDWARSVRDQCVSAGVPLFIKQIHINGKISKDISEWPEDLRRRELPNAI